MSTGSGASVPTSTTRAGAVARRRWRLPPRARKIALTIHVAVSVGWLGSSYTMLVLGLSGLLATDPHLRIASYEIMHLFDRAVNIPLGLGMLLSGLVSALWTTWGLVRHRWVLTKLVISTAVLIMTPILSVPRVLDIVDQLRAGTQTPGLAIEIIAISLGTVITLTTVTTISIFKPWGRTRWGRR